MLTHTPIQNNVNCMFDTHAHTHHTHTHTSHTDTHTPHTHTHTLQSNVNRISDAHTLATPNQYTISHWSPCSLEPCRQQRTADCDDDLSLTTPDTSFLIPHGRCFGRSFTTTSRNRSAPPSPTRTRRTLHQQKLFLFFVSTGAALLTHISNNNTDLSSTKAASFF